MSEVNNKILIDTKKRRGRPRAFERDVALQRATRLFWAKGYAETSLEDLTAVLGINRPSLYSSFGNKEALFCLCLQEYARTQAPRALLAMMAAPNIFEAVAAFFTAHLVCISGDGEPTGCFLSATLTGEATLPVQACEIIHRHLSAGEEAIEAVFDRAKAAGELPPDADVKALAGLLVTLMHGLAVQARSETTRNTLAAKTEAAIAAMRAAVQAQGAVESR